MKKVGIFIALIVLLAGIVVGGWYYLKPHPKGVMPAQILPVDTLLMVEVIDLEKGIDDFKSGKLGQALKKIAFSDVMQKLAVPAEAIKKYNKTRSSVLSTIDSMLFKELFGQETVFAVLSTKIEDPKPEELKKALGNAVLISRPKHNPDVAAFLNLIFVKTSKIKTEAYSGYKINSYDLGHKFSIYYSMADGLLIASLGRQTVKKCLDFRINRQTSLIDNKYYQNLRDKLGSSEIRGFIYNNTEKTYEDIFNIIRSLNKKKDKLAAIEGSLASFKGLKAIGCASYDDGSDLLRDKMLVLVDKNELEPIYAKAYSFKPEENKTLKMVPHNAIAYYWVNTLDLKSYLDIFFNNASINEEAKKTVRERFKKEVGIGVDEVFQALGNEFGLILTDITTGGPFPVPKLIMFIEAANQGTVVKLIESTVQKFGMRLEKETYEDIEIKYLVLPMGSDIQPAYAFFKGYCIMSISRLLIKDMITTFKDGKDITSDPDFQYINKGMTDKNNSIMFIKCDQLIDKIRQLVGWGNNLMAFKSQDAVEKGRVIVNGVIYPVLDGLKMYKTLATRTVIKENEVEANQYSRVDRQKD
ncbi:MAG TPA: hypothetical protein DDW42_00900 [Desulfobacteraceae bacterium]|nr:hypothetical protein [Desulfobacteraceae bacterium]